jgi:hypothetical protein
MATPNGGRVPCEHRDCFGVRLPTGGRCWAHADHPDLEAAFEQLGRHGRLDARGVPITPELLQRIVAAAPTTNTVAPS